MAGASIAIPKPGLTLDQESTGQRISADYVAATRPATAPPRSTAGPLARHPRQRRLNPRRRGLPDARRDRHRRRPASIRLRLCPLGRQTHRSSPPRSTAGLGAEPAGAQVLYAAPEQSGRILVRLGTGDARTDCRAPATPPPAQSSKPPADTSLILPGEGDLASLRAPPERRRAASATPRPKSAARMEHFWAG